MTELTNQDPLEPMNNKDFIVQMAQFSSVEQLNNLNENLTNLLNAQILSQASEMIGYKVEGKDLSTGKIIQGKVKQVYLKDNQVYLLIGDKSIPFSSITKIISKN
ncbi:flagellar hook capping protein [Candidatus Aerophobetes bacterium]|uniref:Flagellar hook capping protein n=1 Tax=Aerophobetes bacterium TaxID=2030807 RepID=A0A662DGI7_UNCAE|nr:MAG: flagellar hook capping protein [Candidatus Aerophobetes bacterium]